jgi:aspartyl-tRNA(Asn)/glutamyl-tRNA(Gln) amidotransferase subunit B
MSTATQTDYELVCGLEVHCQLGTKTKLFCSCGTDGFGAMANTRICPVCTGQPGVLPVLNRRAVELAFRAALALEMKLAPESIFARKNYFYPDLPKAYQISQYEQPYSQHGRLAIRLKDGTEKVVRIHRIHMEEDAGKLLHEIGSETLDHSLVDFNRGGVPLIEIVTEPDIRSSEEAYAYLTALKEVLIAAGVSRCDMEKGEMRCDANVSLRPRGQEKFGTRAEIKNLNSFKGVKDAMDYEVRRQAEILDGGGKIVQETRLWDAHRMETKSMRSKEEAHDYRYFPDPDLVPLVADAEWISKIRETLPELPAAKRARYEKDFGLSAYDADVLASDVAVSAFYDAAVGKAGDAKVLANMVTNDLIAKVHADTVALADCKVKPAMMSELVQAVKGGKISTKGAKEVFIKMWETGEAPLVLIDKLGLSQVSDENQVRDWVKQALAANPQAAADLKGGKDRAIGSIVGAVMKLSKGKANPAVVNALIKEEAAKG